MARRLLLAAAGVITLATTGLASAAQAAPAPASAPASASKAHGSSVHVCSTPTSRHQAACFALRRTDAAAAAGTQRMADAMAAAGGVRPAVTPSGYGPADIQSAYKLSGASASGRTVAIVDAYNDPTAESDLAVYRNQYGLPACTTANGCFTKMNQNGGTTSFPRTNGGWAQEISLDLDMVSAACPSCKILLVEASSASLANLATAVNTAARQPGVVAISNSYGGGDSSENSAYNHSGIAITASTGDSGYGVEYPASSQYVTAVGGTSLARASNTRGWSESAWSGAGSGCSSYNAQPAFQASVGTGCSRRATADVSAVADPNTGVAVYDSTAYQGVSGWLVFGGTSASAPIVASVYALAGNTGPSFSGYANALPYGQPTALNDVTTGSNGTCSVSQLCHARVGWDGPTGLGTPNGTGAF